MKIYLYAVCFLLLGCGRTTAAEQNENSGDPAKKLVKLQPIIKPEKSHVIVGPEKRKKIAFAEYRNICLSIEGTEYDERDEVCRCKAKPNKNLKFTLVKNIKNRRRIEPRCEEIYPLSQPKGYDSFSKFLAEVGLLKFREWFKNVQQKNRASPEFHFSSNIPDEAYFDLANDLDSKPLFLDIPQSYGRGNVLNLRIGYGQSDASSLKTPIKQLTRVWGSFSRSIFQVYGPRYDLFMRDFSSLRSLAGLSSDDRSGWKFPTVPASNRNKAELNRLKLASETLSKFLFQNGPEPRGVRYKVDIIEDGCHLRCFVSMEFSTNGDKFRYEKMYIYGEIVASRLVRFDRDVVTSGGVYASLAYFGRGDSISVVVVNKKNTEDLSAGWEMDVYDENLNPMVRFEENRIPEPSVLLEALSIPNQDIENTSPVILLEGLVDYRDSFFMKWVKKGPYRSTNYLSGGSLLGWKNAIKKDNEGFYYSDFYDGFFTSNLYNPEPEEKYFHANIVGRQIIGFGGQVGAVSIVPTSWNDYTNDRMEGLYTTAQLSNARVINLSGIVQTDGGHSCPLNDTRFTTAAIWVLGAGNDSLENPKDTCEQNLKPLHRKLVVAANVEGTLELEAYSDFGVDYADLSASGISYDMHGDMYEGTSFAAPKVSNTAATIINMYGSNLSNQLVRLAILLSVDVDVYSPMKTRTGGRLNKPHAIEAARFMSGVIDGSIDFPYNLTKKQIMARIIRASGSLSDEDEIQKQVDWLVSNGI